MRIFCVISIAVFATAASVAAARGQEEARPDGTPPKGFVSLVRSDGLTGWKGLIGNPRSRARMPHRRRGLLQRLADGDMCVHWKVEDGVLSFDGRGRNICTMEEYADFELYVDWKIGKGGDSGIYLRGTPQVQIWDASREDAGTEVGSGGLFNNRTHPSKPIVKADNPVGQWNTFHVKMVGDRVTVKLNGKLVVDNVVMENSWEPGKPIAPRGQIELQGNGSRVWFRNVFLRKLEESEE